MAANSDGPPIHAVENKAAGQPTAGLRLTLARFQEALGQSIKGRESDTDAHEGRDIAFAGFLGLVVAIGAVLVVGIWIGAR